jgi:ATP-dependent DNA helicase RecQ
MVDGTRKALMLFGVIKDTGQMFGAAHIIDVLRGGETAKIKERGHERLAGYGAGAEYAKAYWQAFIRQAVAGNYLIINIQKYGALQIARMGQAVVAGEEAFAYREIDITKPARKAKKRKAEKLPVAEGDQDLLAALKTLRLDLARAKKVPAYVVFPDATLMEMARARPATLDEMADINGVGPRKLEDFGEIFLKTVSRC